MRAHPMNELFLIIYINDMHGFVTLNARARGCL